MTSAAPTRIALISATLAAIPPVREAFAERDSAVELWNIVDDRLLLDADAAGALTGQLEARFERLVEYAAAASGQVDGILVTCSFYGSLVPALKGTLPVPLLAADEALFAAAVSGDHERILVVSSAEGPLTDSIERLGAALAEAGRGTELSGIAPEGAFAAARSSDAGALPALLVEVIGTLPQAPEAIVLAQYSLSHAAEALAATFDVPVYTGPGAAAEALRSAIAEARA